MGGTWNLDQPGQRQSTTWQYNKREPQIFSKEITPDVPMRPCQFGLWRDVSAEAQQPLAEFDHHCHTLLPDVRRSKGLIKAKQRDQDCAGEIDMVRECDRRAAKSHQLKAPNGGHNGRHLTFEGMTLFTTRKDHAIGLTSSSFRIILYEVQQHQAKAKSP